MSVEVLEAIRPHLAAAHYIGLTHAGEPTIAPALDPLLSMLREERQGAATVVHVVSNGMALTARRFEEIVAAGISSFSFSLDGVSPETNDALRVGAKVVVLMQRLRGFVELRKARRLDVRLGVSCTITRSNIHEVLALAQFVVDAGLDCLKLEETFPVNARGFQEADVPPSQVRDAVENAKRVCKAGGVRVVDHTVGRRVWKCQPNTMTVDEVEFSLGDDFANRLDINPCRMPWEVVCIEPNGDVKPDNFHQGAVGNLLTTDLLSLWNTEHFKDRRRASVQQRRCGSITTCRVDEGPLMW
jgi:MoaA/NifB/PqqE/SkfB family radical SAM enzyme